MRCKQLALTIGLFAGLFLSACSVHKQAVSTQPSEPVVVEKPHWHTCLTSRAKATVTTSSEQVSATITMQAVHDSLIVVSVMPMMSIEMARIEATPDEIVVFDKIYHRYAVATYDELNSMATPHLSWELLEQICAGELPTGNEEAELRFRFGKQEVSAHITYTTPQLDVPLRISRLPRGRYTQIDYRKWF